MKETIKKWIKMLGCFAIALSCAFIPVKAETYTVEETFPPEIQKWHRLQGTGIPSMFLIDGEVGWCIEPGKHAHIGENELHSFEEIGYTRELGKKLAYIAYWGYRVNPTVDNFVLTQNLLWETIGTKAGNDGYFYVSPQYPTRQSQKAWQEAVLAKVAEMEVRPSFDEGQYTLNVGETITLEDTNGVLANYSVTPSKGLTVSQDGNKLTITATQEASENTFIRFKRKISVDATGSLFGVKHGDSQAVSTVYIHDPATATLNLKINKYASAKINKVDEDGASVQGAVFNVSYNSDMSNPIGSYTTDSQGNIQLNDLLPQPIYVQEVSAPNHLLVDDDIKMMNLIPNQLTSLQVVNNWKEGKIQFVKKDADTNKTILLGNTQFDLFKKDGTFVGTFTTDGTGTITTTNLRYGDYYAIEKKAPNGYLTNPNRFDLQIREHNSIVQCVVSDKKVSGKVVLTKEDKETTKPQGDATLEGAVYGIYARENILDPSNDGTVLFRKDALVSQGTIKNGVTEINLDYLGKYYVKEIKAPEGYQLSEEKVNVDLTYNGQTTPLIIKNLTVKEEVITGKVSITKYLANVDSAEILEPEENAEFNEATSTQLAYGEYVRRNEKRNKLY